MSTVNLEAMFRASLVAIDPADLVEAALRRLDLDPGSEPVVVLALGKAAPGMVWGAHRVYGDAIQGAAAMAGEATLPSGVDGHIGGHPLPDQGSLRAGDALFAAAAAAPAGSLVLCLVSGGGSALADVLRPGIGLDELADLNRRLVLSGAAIAEINVVRRALSRLKGGGLASQVSTGRLVTLAISDVGTGSGETIASGPTVVPAVGGATALDILARLNLGDAIPPHVLAALGDVSRPGPREQIFEIVADGTTAAAAAAAHGRSLGLTVRCEERPLHGEARFEVKRVLREAATAGADVVVHTGEASVTVRGDGRGGRNHEAALAAAIAIDGTGTSFLAAGTDGIDGFTAGAGAVVDGTTVPHARQIGLDPGSFLENNDSDAFFDRVPGRIVTGPTGTNVADLWMIAVPQVAT